ncbi:transmembrane protein 135-like [Balamuthia mandrillaris]
MADVQGGRNYDASPAGEAGRQHAVSQPGTGESNGVSRPRSSSATERLVTALKEIVNTQQAKEVARKLRGRTREEREAENPVLYVLRGVAKGFLIYCVPLTLLRRRVTGARRGLAIGMFVGVVRALDRVLRWTNIPTSRWRRSSLGGFFGRHGVELPLHAVSGALAAYIAIKIDRSLLNSVFVFWCLVRAARSLPLPSVPHGPTIVMCISAAQILTSWIISRQHIPKSYRKFLDIHGQKDNPRVNTTAVLRQQYCPVVHPGQGCIAHSISFFLNGYQKAVKVYIPLYLVFFIFAKHKSVKRLVLNVAQSSAFLAAYCCLAYISGCLFYRFYPGKMGRTSFLLHLWVAGLATLIERPSRRPELAAYCLTFALESLYRYMLERYRLPVPRSLSLLAICLSAAVMLHHHTKQPAVAMNWLFGIY